ncbi:MAG TPA: sugar ABC transporter substrate-binding protein [Christensenellaceae bacterium]|jgi:multiple sugar transport system substrate-binding protein|nr:sugar ABC transporter substrate-binding protein [Christensenellaceae bacterium]
MRKKFNVLTLFVVLLLLCNATICLSDSEKTTDPRRLYEGVTLNVLLKEGYEIEVMQKYYKDFEDATGIKVNLEVYDEPTTRQKFILDVTSKTGFYDITATSFWYFPEYQINGWLAPIDEFIAEKTDPEWYKKEDIPQSAMDTFSADGVHYCMPQTIISGMGYYRKDILEKHGLNPPETVDDVMALIPIIKEKEPELLGIAERGAPNFASLGTYLGWAWGYGAQLLDEDYGVHANSPEMLEAITDLVSIIRNYGPADSASLTFIQMAEKYTSGNCFFFFDTSGHGSAIEDPKQSVVNGKTGYVIMEGPIGRPLQWLYMEGLGINAYSKNKEAAWLFLQWRMSRETTMKEFEELARTDVPNLYVLNSPEYSDFAETKGVSEYTTKLQESWEMADINYWPFIPQFVEIGDAFMIEISAAIAGTQDVKTALDNAQRSIEIIMQEAGY